MAGNKDWIETVKSLLQRAAHPNTPKSEAETATAAATKIMAKHRIDESMLGAKSESIDKCSFLIDGFFLEGQLGMFTHIATALDCRLVMITEAMGGYACFLVGHQSDIRKFQMIDQLLLVQCINALAKQPVPESPFTALSFATSFLIGFGQGVAERMKGQTEELISEPGSALALIDRIEMVDDMAEEMFGPLDALALSGHNLEASLAGAEAARNSDVGDSKVQNERKEIGYREDA